MKKRASCPPAGPVEPPAVGQSPADEAKSIMLLVKSKSTSLELHVPLLHFMMPRCSRKTQSCSRNRNCAYSLRRNGPSRRDLSPLSHVPQLLEGLDHLLQSLQGVEDSALELAPQRRFVGGGVLARLRLSPASPP